MAQTIFINVTVDKVTRPDGQDHTHQAVRGTAAASDLTVSIDTTNVKSRTQIKYAMQRALQVLAGDNTFTN